MSTRVVNLRNEPCEVYIGRPSQWGNPFKVYPMGERTRQQAIEEYREWILKQPKLLAALPDLVGKRLGCYCAPLPCHGDVLVELLNDRKEA